MLLSALPRCWEYRWEKLRSLLLGLRRWLCGKESACQCRRHGFNPRLREMPRRRQDDPLQYSCLKNPIVRAAWQAAVHGVTKHRGHWATQHAPLFGNSGASIGDLCRHERSQPLGSLSHFRRAQGRRGAPPCPVVGGGTARWWWKLGHAGCLYGSVLLPSRRAGNFTLHVFPSRAPAGEKETGSTEPSGNQGGWAGISQPFPGRSGLSSWLHTTLAGHVETASPEPPGLFGPCKEGNSGWSGVKVREGSKAMTGAVWGGVEEEAGAERLPPRSSGTRVQAPGVPGSLRVPRALD